MTDKEINELGRQEYAKWRQEKDKVNALTAAQLEELNYISMVKHRYSNEQHRIDGGWIHDYDRKKYDKDPVGDLIKRVNRDDLLEELRKELKKPGPAGEIR